MRNKLRKLSAKNFFEEEEKFIKKFNEYTSKKIEINKEENLFISKIDKGDNFSKKCDIYFIEYEDVVFDFEKRREELKKEYKKYYSIYNTDFYTIVNQEYVDCISSEDISAKQTAERFLKCIEENKGKYFTVNSWEEKYRLEYIAVQIDDYYYIGTNDQGEEKWISGAFKIKFL